MLNDGVVLPSQVKSSRLSCVRASATVRGKGKGVYLRSVASARKCTSYRAFSGGLTGGCTAAVLRCPASRKFKTQNERKIDLYSNWEALPNRGYQYSIPVSCTTGNTAAAAAFCAWERGAWFAQARRKGHLAHNMIAAVERISSGGNTDGGSAGDVCRGPQSPKNKPQNLRKLRSVARAAALGLLSRVPAASAGIFPYIEKELEVRIIAQDAREIQEITALPSR